MKSAFRKTVITGLLSFGILSCNSNVEKPDEVNSPITASDKPQASEKVNDKYIGTWIDINRDPKDSSELITIVKLHDKEYQLGSLTGELKSIEKDGKQEAEYLSVWSEEYGAEMQFLYDDFTQHLIMRTPFMSKELRKAN